MYASGTDIPQNKIKAYIWWSMAKTKGFEISAEMVMLKNHMTREQIAEAQTIAARCFESNYKDCD